MVKETKYGVISDVHSDPRVVPVAIDTLKRHGAERLLVNGDIGNQQRSLQDSQNYVAFILDSIGKSGLESFVQPGSHETLLAFGPVLDHFAGQYSNIIDTTKNRKIEQEGHDLVFLPGSDFLCGGEYKIGNHEQIPSGRYIQTEKGLMQFEEFEQYVGALQQGVAQEAMQYSNMGDLRKLVSDPNKTIVVCHVPRKFDNLENCVDVSHFHQQRVYHRDFNRYPLKDWTYTEICIQPGTTSRKDIEAQGIRTFGLGESEDYILDETIKDLERENQDKIMISVEKKENRGNEDLRDVYEELGIVKAVSGHFHESGHRANDRKSNHVQEGQKVRELFWNSGYLDSGQTGILIVRGDEVSYQNIQLK